MFRRCIWTVTLGVFLLTSMAFARTTEYYFKFEYSSQKELEKITRLVSIDNVKDGVVYAYANEKQFDYFKTLGYDYEILPAPSTLHQPRMTDDKDLILDWDYYPTYTGYLTVMYDFASTYPNLCHIENIGYSVEGRQLLFVKLSDNVDIEESEPELMYSSTMHGDETTGYILMIHLIDYLLSNYGTDPQATALLNNCEIWINPNANPDGTYAGGNNTVWDATRNNSNGVNLNRNFPDPDDGQHPDGNSWQPETQAMLDFFDEHNFVLSANFHGGAEVVNYPWDTWSHLTADDDWWVSVSREYADSAQANSPSGYMTDLNNGITNGYAWYTITGGRQDCLNYWYGCREVTIELSSTKTVPENELEDHWDYNKGALLTYLEQCYYGVRGVITNYQTGVPVDAIISVVGHDQDSSEVYSDPDHGDYYRMIYPGTYSFRFIANGYVTQTIDNVVVTSRGTTNLDVQMQPLSTDPLIEFAGQNAGNIDAGDNVSMGISLTNVGGGEAVGVEAVLSTSDSYITLTQNSSTFPTIAALGGVELSNSDYVFDVNASCPPGHQVEFRLDITENSGYTDSLFFDVGIGLQVENYEVGNFSNYDWQLSGDANWFIESGGAYEGIYAARSGDIDDEENTVLSLDYYATNQDSISFFLKVSSEATYDSLRFYIDSTLIQGWSGSIDWTHVSYQVAAGEHKFKWEYMKDINTSNGSDCAWLDYIILPMTSVPIQIVTETLPDWTMGYSYSQQLEANGGTGELTWIDYDGGLAEYGLALSSNGMVVGTPDQTGEVSFTARVTDDMSVYDDQILEFTINPAVAITTESIPDATVNEPYEYQLEGGGGTDGLTWIDRDDNLAGSGIGMSETGLLSGTSSNGIDITFVALLTDGVGASDEQILVLGFEVEFLPGDANNDGRVIGADVTYLVQYFAGNNPAPDPFYAGDANGDCSIIGSDVTYLVNYFRGIGSAPVVGDCPPIAAKLIVR